MDINQLTEIIENDAAIRRRQSLQPVGGRGDKIFPPTYPGEGRNAPPTHVYERRRVDGKELWCVLVDSVQSQANRLEECLLQAVNDGMPVPHVVVDFRKTGLHGIVQITSLDAPHRVYDAILRDSHLNGAPFMESDLGKQLVNAKAQDATPLLEVSPSALLFGAWHSTGEGGGLGAKFARCLISEIIAVDVPVMETIDQRTGEIKIATAGRRTGSRIDPLGVLKGVKIYRKAGDGNEWTADEKLAERDSKGNAVLYSRSGKAGKPSVINHGNITPSITPLGITCDHLEHSFVLSLAALRRLSFGSAERNRAGRTLLATLGLLALAEQDRRGYALRSRCDLVCDGYQPLQIVKPDGTTSELRIDLALTRTLYGTAFEHARAAGFKLTGKPLVLQPQDKLVDIVRRSQELALASASDEEDQQEENADR